MHAVATEIEVTPEDLLAMPDGKSFELVGGELVERNSSALSSWVGGQVIAEIARYLEVNPVGRLWGADNGYQCFADAPKKVRKPDVSFIRNERIPADWQIQGFLRVAPDLAVEVVSPNDLAEELEAKVEENIRAGVALVWVIYPELRKVSVFRADGSMTRLREADELTGDEVLPGYSCRVSTLFPAPTSAPSPTT
jgi:Uma2 family endonuclease